MEDSLDAVDNAGNTRLHVALMEADWRRVSECLYLILEDKSFHIFEQEKNVRNSKGKDPLGVALVTFEALRMGRRWIGLGNKTPLARRRSQPARQCYENNELTVPFLLHVVSAWQFCDVIANTRPSEELQERNNGNDAAVSELLISWLYGSSGVSEKEKIAKFSEAAAWRGGFLRLRLSFRVRILSSICWTGQADLLREVAKMLNASAEDASIHLDDCPSPLWVAASTANRDTLDVLLNLEGVLIDAPSPDGSTAFAVALGREDVLLVATLFNYETSEPELQQEMMTDVNVDEVESEAMKRFIVGVSTDRHDSWAPPIKYQHKAKRFNKRLLDLSLRFPLVNDATEKACPVYKARLNELMAPNSELSLNLINEHILGSLCIRSEDASWRLDSLQIPTCNHTPDAHLNCAIIGDLVQLAAELERQLRGSTDGVMKHLKPAFFVAGSIAEGTRVILANELDLTLSFESWKTHPPFAFNPEDPFNLYKSFPCPTWMEDFFDENEAFSLVRFSGYLFKIVQQGIHTTGIPCTIKLIFKMGRRYKRPYRLRMVKKNANDLCTHCKENAARSKLTRELFRQCEKCCVAVSQTKIGLCLQFQWRRSRGYGQLRRLSDTMLKSGGGSSDADIFCSVDIVPKFDIQPVSSLELARSVNRAMLGPFRPKGWFKYLKNYVSAHRMVNLRDYGEQDSNNASDDVNAVILKLINAEMRKYYYVCPAQAMGPQKFHSWKIKIAYCQIKVLKQALGISGLKMFMAKKEMLKHSFGLMESTTNPNALLFRILSRGEFKAYFEGKIDFAKWEENLGNSSIPLRGNAT